MFRDPFFSHSEANSSPPCKGGAGGGSGGYSSIALAVRPPRMAERKPTRNFSTVYTVSFFIGFRFMLP